MTTSTSLSALSATGLVHLPGSPDYARLCTPWNLAVAQSPAAVASPTTIDEVRALVVAAGIDDVRVAPQSTGHGAAALAPGLTEALLLRLDRLTGVTVDPTVGTARIVGATLWQEVAHAVAPHGYAAMHGSAPDVSAIGYLLGGGLSFYARQHGLAVSSVLSLDVITADGQLRHAGPTTNPELFWALLGGGGSFGVVVAAEIALLPYQDVYAGMLLWDMAAAPAVVRRWVEWTQSVPESATTSLRLMRFPPLPELPPFLSGRELVVIDGAVLDDDDTANDMLARLRELGPEIDTFGRIPTAQLLSMHMDPPAPTPSVTDHALLGGLPDEAVSALLALAGPGVASPLMFAEVRHTGGALSRPIDAALDRLPGDYLLFTVAAVPGPEMAAACSAATSEVVDALRPWSVGATFANFRDRAGDSSTGYDAVSWERLVQVRDAVDPDHRWLAANEID